MSVEAITDAIQEYMYEKPNDSPETDEETKIRHVEKRIFNLIKEQADKNTKFRRVDCPARGRKCANCGKPGHYAKCCCSAKKFTI